MTEQELQILHYTSPRDMDGVTRLKQHDNLHRQMAAFEKLLQHAHSRFSKEKLYQMLQVLIRGIPKLRYPHHPKQQELAVMSIKVTSVGQVKEIIEKLQNEKRKGIQREEEAHLVRYFETFFRDLEYLRTLKKYFDERIYCCLYEYFYDPGIDDILDSQNEDTLSKNTLSVLPHSAEKQKTLTPTTAVAPSKSPIFALTETQKLHEDGIVGAPVSVDQMSSQERLSHAVKELYELNDRWDYLLSDNELSLLYFDPDSYYELIQYTDQSNFDLVFRLIPDLFVKAYKAIELAKLWWTNANKIYKSFPGKSSSNMKSYTKRMNDLQDKIVKISEDVVKDEEMLNVHKADLEALINRENRFNVLNENCEKVEGMKNSVGIKYNEILKQREVILQKRENTLKSTSHFQDLEKRLRRINMEVLEVYDKLRILTFQFDILEQDLKLELEMRPDIIRFIDHVSEKVTTLDNSLKTKRSIKHAHEKQLVLLRTNHEKMREIMRKYLPSEETVKIESESHPELTIIEYSGTHAVNGERLHSLERGVYKPQTNHVSSDETGNEADTESPQPTPQAEESRETTKSNSNRVNEKESNSAKAKVTDQKYSKSKIPRHSMFRQS